MIVTIHFCLLLRMILTKSMMYSGSDLPSFHMDEKFRTLCADIKVELKDERARIEVNTQNQSLHQDWHH